MKQLYLELVINEFYATYNESIVEGELFIAELTTSHFQLNNELYLILRTGLIKFPICLNPYKIQTQFGRIEALRPNQILALATSPYLLPQQSAQLRQFAFRIENRLAELNREGLIYLIQKLDLISMGDGVPEDIDFFVSSFWHAIFLSPEDQGLIE